MCGNRFEILRLIIEGKIEGRRSQTPELIAEGPAEMVRMLVGRHLSGCNHKKDDYYMGR